jgi:two-component system, OmpR family, response regulator
VQFPRLVLKREQFFNARREHDEEVIGRSIDVSILRLRGKLRANPREPKLIRTEQGVGYTFAASVEML